MLMPVPRPGAALEAPAHVEADAFDIEEYARAIRRAGRIVGQQRLVAAHLVVLAQVEGEVPLLHDVPKLHADAIIVAIGRQLDVVAADAEEAAESDARAPAVAIVERAERPQLPLVDPIP